jgi:hypothetical protein
MPRGIPNKKITASIKVLGKPYQGTGSTIEEAISNLKVPYGKGVAILNITTPTLNKDEVLSSTQTSRLFSKNPKFREAMLKTITLMFNEISRHNI